MNNNILTETLKQYKINQEAIIYRRNKLKYEKTIELLNEVLNEFVIKANDFKENPDMYIVEKDINIKTIHNSDTLNEILCNCIDTKLLKEYCDNLGVVVDITTCDETIKLKFILMKELYINGVFDTYNNEEYTYIDKLNLVFKRK